MNKKSCAAKREESSQARGRSRWTRSLVVAGLLGSALVTMFVVLNRVQASPVRNARELRSWASRYGRLPLSFEANRGQTGPQVKYLARGQGYTLFLTSREAVLALRSGKDGRTGKGPSPAVALRLRLLKAAPSVQVTGEDRLAGQSNYFLGNNPRAWHTHVPNYARVRYHEVYPGIDLVYYGRQGQLENDFVVSPGANPKAIRLGLKGSQGVRLDRAGDLVVKVSGGSVYLRRPRAYQGQGAGRREVAVHYAVGAGNKVGFEVGRYDRKQKLVIDPVLSYSTYLGGNGGDIGYGIAVDSSGDAYIVGTTNSSNFPTTSNAKSGSYSGNGDVFVAKIDPTGTVSSSSTPQLVYSTYLGGGGADSGAAIAVNAGGDAFITGSTLSTDFPTTSGAFQTVYGGSGDAFVTQLSSTGASLVYSSFLGGSGADDGYGIAVDSSSNAYVTGSTQSPDLKVTANAYQSTNQGSSDAFVGEVSFSGSQLTYLTYLGGSQADIAQSVKVDNSGNIYVAGYTFSSNFPLQSPYQGSNAGAVNAFVSEIAVTSTSSSLAFSTYLGGSGDDRAYGLALDSSGNIYVAGSSQSTDFPTTTGVFQLANHGLSDAFVTKINPAAPTNLVYSTLLGGAGTDKGTGIAVDSSGDAFITGFTNSSDFPTQSPIQAVLGINGGSACGTAACSDAFVAELNPAATGLVQSTYLGGSGADFGQAIALDPSFNAYITGSTSSTNFPAIGGAYQSSLTGLAGNAFVAEIGSADSPSISIVPQTVDFGNQTQSVRSSVKTVSVVNEGTSPLSITSITFSETDSTGYTNDFAETDNCVGTLAASGGSCSINITFRPQSTSPESGTFSIADNAANNPHTIDVTGTGVTTATAVTVAPSSLTFGNVTVGSVSSAQTVAITNTGTQTLTIANITASGDFSQTNTCGTLQNVLNVGQSCSVSVTFAPTVSGARNGSLSISDNATGSPQSVALSGTGVAQFTLSSSSPSVTTLIGNTTATFTIAASAPSSFTGSITLACPSNLAANGTTCSFSPAYILAGQTSTLTISNLTDALPVSSVNTTYGDQFPFEVTGTSGSQSTTVDLSLLFADYSLSPAAPSLATVVAGAPASYTLILTPINGFSSQVQLACGSGMPSGASCTFSKSSVTPSGNAVSVTLTVHTTKKANLPPPPGIPPGVIPPLTLSLFVLILVGSLVLVQRRNRLPNPTGRRWLCLQVGMLSLLILGAVFLGSCRSAPGTTGSTTGNYTITVNGTLGSNSSVVRSTYVNLAITCPPGQTCS